MTDYITSAELKAQLSIADATDDTQIALAVKAGSRMVETLCGGRTFGADVAATARVFVANSAYEVQIDDAWAITTVKTGTGGTYGTTLTAYWTLPLNGVGGDGLTGSPITHLRSEGLFAVASRPTVEVTAKWGWAAVPDAVKQAAMLLSARLFRLRDVPFGVVASSVDIGLLPVRDIKDASTILAPYKVRWGVA